jgi:hypothetical protein
LSNKGNRVHISDSGVLEKKIKTIIKHTVKEAIDAERVFAAEQVKKQFDSFRETEKRLSRMQTLRTKVAKDKERLQDLIDYPVLPARSKDIIIAPFSTSTVRLSEAEIIEGLKKDLRARIAADERELQILSDALESIKDHGYRLCVIGRYEKGMTDAAIASELMCSEKSVWRMRGKLIREYIAVMLYGSEA